MGGLGSGRHWHWDAKATTQSYRRIDVRHLAREGLLKAGRRFSWQWTADGQEVASIQMEASSDDLRLHYRSRSAGQEWEAMDYKVRLLSQQCHLGGQRTWFACPAQGCGRRVAILYGGRVFACRHCYRLAYQSQREPGYVRHLHRAQAIKRKLGWYDEIDELVRKKPHRMHWTTFLRLVDELEAREGASNVAFNNYIATMQRRLGI